MTTSYSTFLIRLPTFSLFVLGWLIPMGCGPAVSENGDDELTISLSESQPKGDEVPEIQVPDGTADELFQFMAEVEAQELDAIGVKVGQRMDDVDPAAYSRALRRIMTARVSACDKVLAADVSEQSYWQAIHMKLEALRLLRDIDRVELGPPFDAYVAELLSVDDARLALYAKTARFQALVTDIIAQPDTDESTMLVELRELVDDPLANDKVFHDAYDAIQWLVQSGRTDIAAKGCRTLGERLPIRERPQLTALAAQVKRQAAQLDLMQQVDRVIAARENAVDDLLQTLSTQLDELSATDSLGIGIQLTQTLEFAGRFEAVRKVYDVLRQRYRDHENVQLSEDVERSYRLADRRMNLIGTSLEVDGVLLDGEPLQWETYRGHYVVVCFWTTWYEAWTEQVRTMRRQISPYRDDGLKIVTINLDNDRNQLERYLNANPLSWPIVVDPDASLAGFQNPNAIRCGVESVPFVMLVDPSGRVAEIHLLGERLAEALQNHLEPSESNPPQVHRSEQHYFVAHYSPQDSQEASAAAEPERNEDDPESVPREATGDKPIERINPYEPPVDASISELVLFVLEMQDKPQRIQDQPGFSQGVIQAAERILEADTKPRWKQIALLAKLHRLRNDVAAGNPAAQASLLKTLDQWGNDPRPEIAREVRFLRLEQRAQAADSLSLDELEGLLSDLLKFFGEVPLEARHLQLASHSVHAVNRLEEVEQREAYFDQFGELFAKSDDKQLAAYGRRIGKPSAEQGDALNQPLELTGVTTEGTIFNWQIYRDRWVIVDFWASWCGPCRRAMPELRELARRFEPQGIEIVGVSLDKDLQALAEYLQKEELPWTNLAGSGTEELAKKYGIRGIPHLMLVDGEGTIRMVTHRVGDLTKRLEEVFGDKP